MNDRFAYTLKEACEALRCGRTKLYELIKAGKIKAVALGGKTLIPSDSLENFVAELPVIAMQKGLQLRDAAALSRPGNFAASEVSSSKEGER